VFHLGTVSLPIPVIEIPWDHVSNYWELLSLHHEVGHDIEADLKLRGPLLTALQDTLAQAGVPQTRINIWLAWEGETFADLAGLQLGGPAFADSLMHLLLLPAVDVVTFRPDDPHPTHYPRILMNAAYARTLAPGRAEIDAHADDLESTWKALYGEQSSFEPFIGDFPLVFKALMDTKLDALRGQSVREILPFTAADDARIRSAARFLLTGEDAPPAMSLPPRHGISAAQIAVGLAAAEPDGLAERLQTVNERAAQLVKDNAAPGLRASDDSAPHRAFVASFAAQQP
jgi:hypothetical protein